MISGIAATDFDNPALGVKFTHKGYFTAASSHYIHTIRIPALVKTDENGTLIPLIDFSYLWCSNESAFIRNMDQDLVDVFCKQTRTWRSTLVDGNLPYYREQISYETDLKATFRDRSAEINEEASRPTRFLSVLTGAVSLISRILDGYEKIVMARQIRHLANNQQVLFSNQERIMERMQSTQQLNTAMYRNLTIQVRT